MFLPQIDNIANDRVMTNTFYGYNANSVIGDGEFADTENLTTDFFPTISVRPKRIRIKAGTDTPHGMCANESLAYVCGTSFYYDGEKICDVTDDDKTFACMGAYICIFPDKIMYNVKSGDIKYMENKKEISGTAVIEPCTLSGAALEYSDTEPEHVDGALWLDNGVLKEWSDTYGMWTSVPTSYLRIGERVAGEFTESFKEGFFEGDVITLSGCDKKELNGDFLVYAVTDTHIVISATVYGRFIQYTHMTVERSVPDMDFVCEHGNRLWGCSSEKHEIYSSKLGDPSNWKNYSGLVSDAYAATVGTPGDFTGCISYGGYVLFFKENCMHRIYGDRPSDYVVSDISCRGVMKGCERSMCILNGILYYKSRQCVCAYDGSMPESISDVFGRERYSEAAAGAYADKYMISMKNVKEEWVTFSYDQKRGIWIKENNFKINFFTNDEGALYYMTDSEIMLVQQDYKIDGLYPGMDIGFEDGIYPLCPGMMYPGQTPEDIYENDIMYMAETGDIGMDYPDYKYVSKIILRLQIERGSYLRMEIMYDSDGIWERILDINGTGKRSVSIPVNVRRCDQARLRISGRGNMQIYSITKNIEQGSEI